MTMLCTSNLLYFMPASSSQAISRLCNDRYKEARRAAKRRSASVDNLSGVRWVPAILS